MFCLYLTAVEQSQLKNFAQNKVKMTENYHRIATEDGGAACDRKGKIYDCGCNIWVPSFYGNLMTSNPKCVATPLDQAANFFAMKFYSMPSWHRILDGGGVRRRRLSTRTDRFSSVDAYKLRTGHWEIRPIRKEADRIVRWLQLMSAVRRVCACLP